VDRLVRTAYRPVAMKSHTNRPDTRPMKRQAEESQKITLQNRGHPHTTPRDRLRTPENCASQDRSITYVRLPSAPPSRATIALTSIIQCRAKGASTASVHSPITKIIPLNTRRSSIQALPWLLGEYGDSRPICSSVSQQRSLMPSLLTEPESRHHLPINGS
jgi:hypothetical protein